MAMSKAEKKAEKKAANEARRKAREQAQAEVVIAKGRTTAAFVGTYILTQVLPALAPQLEPYQTGLDAVVALGGGALAYTNDDALGDYALGAALVGGIQFIDGLGLKIKTWLNNRQQAAA